MSLLPLRAPAGERTAPRRLAAVALATAALLGLLLATDATALPPLVVLLGPPATGVLAARRGWPWRWAAAPWAATGLSMLAIDWVVTGEDQAFHAVLTLVMVGLVAGASRLGRPRRRVPATADA